MTDFETGKWTVVHDDDETVVWSREAAETTARYWQHAGAQVSVFTEMADGQGGIWMQGVWL